MYRIMDIVCWSGFRRLLPSIRTYVRSRGLCNVSGKPPSRVPDTSVCLNAIRIRGSSKIGLAMQASNPVHCIAGQQPPSPISGFLKDKVDRSCLGPYPRMHASNVGSRLIICCFHAGEKLESALALHPRRRCAHFTQHNWPNRTGCARPSMGWVIHDEYQIEIRSSSRRQLDVSNSQRGGCDRYVTRALANYTPYCTICTTRSIQ
ncbi:hypothetical protein B0T26DRAFT_698005 [Lasiosphaeria miniovina]|uniref:Uncharacterized protein n=1 Tax=Lasiosphaeria miniovina TaxID=1954250 RepID=A0AA40B687_9PEZI|nr:uncharacterized protein B0T26DRAFT_698005 [Lasiosphaeria miniovina]KAK0728455.1 hypothetical protein B0T26DRAFT_698005 [Lasiosphaeria miniovina]